MCGHGCWCDWSVNGCERVSQKDEHCASASASASWTGKERSPSWLGEHGGLRQRLEEERRKRGEARE
jgi:hypothetical protein